MEYNGKLCGKLCVSNYSSVAKKLYTATKAGRRWGAGSGNKTMAACVFLKW